MSDVPATTLYLVRHGETAWNNEHRWQGWSDVPLSDVGREQADSLASAFRDVALGCVYASDLARARDTAAPIVAATGAPLVEEPSLRERSFGRWEGRTNPELEEEFPDEMNAYRADREGYCPPGGQSWREFAAASVAAFEEVAGRHREGGVALVTHGGPIRAFVNHVLGIERGSFNPYSLDNASISVVSRQRHEVTGRTGWRIDALNMTAHLRSDGRIVR